MQVDLELGDLTAQVAVAAGEVAQGVQGGLVDVAAARVHGVERQKG